MFAKEIYEVFYTNVKDIIARFDSLCRISWFKMAKSKYVETGNEGLNDITDLVLVAGTIRNSIYNEVLLSLAILKNLLLLV